MTMTIVEFLEARLAEDEAVARACADADHEGPELRVRIVRGEGMYVFGPHEIAPSGRFGYEEDARTRHFERHDPARILREIAAKRAILAQEEAARSQFEHVKTSTTYPAIEVLIGQVAALATVIRHLASAYSDHPDYQQEWALNP